MFVNVREREGEDGGERRGGRREEEGRGSEKGKMEGREGEGGEKRKVEVVRRGRERRVIYYARGGRPEYKATLFTVLVVAGVSRTYFTGTVVDLCKGD